MKADKPRHVHLPLKSISNANWDLKIREDEKYEVLTKLIEIYGQIIPVQVRQLRSGKYEIITGRKIYQSLRELQVEKVFCFNHGQISSERALKIAIETDIIPFELDTVSLAEGLKELAKTHRVEDLVDTVPLTEDEIRDYIRYLDFDWKQIEEQVERAKEKAKERREKAKVNDASKVGFGSLFK